MKQCDVCGYTSDSPTAINQFPDGLMRCQVCVSKAVHGRYIRDDEVAAAEPEQLDEWVLAYDRWYESLAKESDNATKSDR